MDVDGADIATPRQVYSKFCRSVKSQQNTKVLVDRTTLEKPLVKSPFWKNALYGINLEWP